MNNSDKDRELNNKSQNKIILTKYWNHGLKLMDNAQ